MKRDFIYRFPDFNSARQAVLELDKLPTDVVTGINYFKRGDLYVVATVVEGDEGDFSKAKELLDTFGLVYDKTLGELLDQRWEFQALGTAPVFMKQFKTG